MADKKAAPSQRSLAFHEIAMRATAISLAIIDIDPVSIQQRFAKTIATRS
jgi:hypothetical protein